MHMYNKVATKLGLRFWFDFMLSRLVKRKLPEGLNFSFEKKICSSKRSLPNKRLPIESRKKKAKAKENSKETKKRLAMKVSVINIKEYIKNRTMHHPDI